MDMYPYLLPTSVELAINTAYPINKHMDLLGFV